MFCFILFCVAAIGGGFVSHYFDKRVINLAYEARDFAYKNFNDARVEYKKLKAGVAHDLDKVLSVF